jgi:hypothetical protein
MSYSPKRIVRIRGPVGYAAAGEGPGVVEGVGDTERATLNGGVAGTAKADRSGRLDGPAIGVSGPGVGFGWGGLSLSCGAAQKCNWHMMNNDAHFRCLSTSIELEFVGQCNGSS